MESLQGKAVLITGGTSGIGRAAALAFVRQGAKVVIAARGEARGRQVEQELQQAGGQALFVPADVTQGDQVAALLQATLQAFGRLDCAFNNAGTLGDPGLTADLEEAQFDHMLAVNLKSVWIAMKYEIQHMLRQKPPGGAIVNTTSVNGLGGAPGASLYAAAKAGVLGLTKSAAMEYADQGIRVNALAAGSFRTPMLEAAMDHYAGGDPQALEEVQEAYRQQIPLGRIGRPEEAAQAAMWLCSEAASYVTGHTLIVDGGMSAAMR